MNKLSRMAADIPFHHLSNAAAQVLPHGWCHHAIWLFNYTQHQGPMVVQASIWKDKKIVGVLHNHMVQVITEEFGMAVQ